MIWQPQAGPQTDMILSEADETLGGGQRGGGKTMGGILWLLKGNYALPEKHPVHATSVNWRHYKALVVRRHAQDLRDWIDQAWEVFKDTGAQKHGQPIYFEWPSGAKIYTDHLNDEDAFNKYRGWNLTRILIEELTEIPFAKWYVRLFGSMRSRKEENGQYLLKPQVLATTNPDGVGHCVPYGDVLTVDGWRDIKDIRVGDSVWSIDPSNGEMVLKPVEQIHQEHFAGSLYHSSSRGFQIDCTPEHKVLRFNGTKTNREKLVLQPIKDFPGQATILRTALRWKGNTPEAVSVTASARRKRSAKLVQPTSISGVDYAALTGWMVTEGSLVRRDNALCISQSKPDGRKKIEDLLAACGFARTWSKHGVLIYSHEWMEMFSWMGHAPTKRVPLSVKQYGSEALSALLRAMVDGDGHWITETSGSFFTSSEGLAADFAEIALKCGYVVRSSRRQRPPKNICGKRLSTNLLPSYEVAFHKQAVGGTEVRSGAHVYNVDTSTQRVNVSRLPFSGTVYCIGIADTHTFIVRQCGAVWISGNSWVKKRFVEVYSKGKPIPPNTMFRDPVTGMTRIFIPARLEDNKYLGSEYEQMLLAQRSESEATYQAWRHGRWDVFSGQFYDTYRPHGPRDGEPAWANHTFDAADAQLAPYWPVSIGVDWGYNHESAAYWGRWGQNDKRLYIFREFVVRQLGSRQLGQEIAKRTLPDIFGLGDQAHIPLFLSHDAFSVEDNTRTRAELFAEGIDDILGPGSAHVADLTDGEKKMEPQAAFDAATTRLQAISSGPCITIHRARSDRAAMAAYTREMLNWSVLDRKDPDLDYARSLLSRNDGHVLSEQYIARFQAQKPQDAVPKLKIERSCIRLKEALQSAVYDENNTEVPMKVNSTPGGDPGDDPHDAMWYLLMGARMTVNRKPRSVFIDERLAKLRAQFGPTPDPALVHQVLEKANSDYGATRPAMEPFSVDRLM